MASTVIDEPLIASARARHRDGGSSVGASTSRAGNARRPGKGAPVTKPPGGNRTTPEHEANAADLKLSAGGHTDCDVHISPRVGYRLNDIFGPATDTLCDMLHLLTSNTDGNGGSCFDFGNAETNSPNDGPATTKPVRSCKAGRAADRASDAIAGAVQVPSSPTGTDRQCRK